MEAVGTPYDNAMVESLWGRMQVELLNRQHWKTRIEVATAIHDYIELSTIPDVATARCECSRQPNTNTNTTPPRAPPDSRTPTPKNQGQIKVSVEPKGSPLLLEQNDEWLVPRRYVSEHLIRQVLSEAEQIEEVTTTKTSKEVIEQGGDRAQRRPSREHPNDDQNELHQTSLLD